MLIFDPCIPPFPKWWIISSHNCSNNNNYSSVDFIFIFVSYFLTFYVLVNLVATVALALLCGPLGMIFAFLSHLKHININNKNAKMRRISMQPFHRRIVMYKGIQLLVNLFNECYQWVFFTVLLFLGYFIISINLFTFVGFQKEISNPASFLLGMLTVEGLIGIFILNSLSGKVYHSSSSLLKVYSRIPSSSGNYPKHWIKKTVASCQGIKIRMGSVNFIDRLTPFVVCGFCIRLAVRLSLTVKNY
jgi:hypothetical protein